jgi:hypothetical protein
MVEKRIKELQKLLDNAWSEEGRLLRLVRENAAGRANDIANMKQPGGDLIVHGPEAEVIISSFLAPHSFFFFFGSFLPLTLCSSCFPMQVMSDIVPLVTKLNTIGSPSPCSPPS